MKQFISAVPLLVPDYDEGLKFYMDALGLDLIEDTVLSADKRWVLVAPPGSEECKILLTKAASPEQQAAIGQQAGGRVFLFLQTDSFALDHARLVAAGVTFLEAPRDEPYGTVAVFTDPFGNKWDLVQLKEKPPASSDTGGSKT